jgi:hypothetical protein
VLLTGDRGNGGRDAEKAVQMRAINEGEEEVVRGRVIVPAKKRRVGTGPRCIQTPRLSMGNEGRLRSNLWDEPGNKPSIEVQSSGVWGTGMCVRGWGDSGGGGGKFGSSHV